MWLRIGIELETSRPVVIGQVVIFSAILPQFFRDRLHRDGCWSGVHRHEWFLGVQNSCQRTVQDICVKGGAKLDQWGGVKVDQLGMEKI